MRSEYVFAAAKEITNRFWLCRVASVSARRLQVGAKQSSETINQSLLLIAAAEPDRRLQSIVLTERKPRTKKQLEQRLQTILKEIESLAPGT